MTFSGNSLCTINNSALFCTALLKTACCQQEQTLTTSSSSSSPLPPHSQRALIAPGTHIFSPTRNGVSGVRTHSRKNSSGGGGGGVGGGVDSVDSGGRDVLSRSKPIPIQRQRSKRERDSMTSQGFFPNSTCGVGSTGASYTSPAYFPQSWSVISVNEGGSSGGGRGSSRHTPKSYRSWVIIPEPSDSELESGYEADVEQGSHSLEVAESCGEMEDSELKEGELLHSLTSYLVPPEVQQRVWLLVPIWYCIDMLQENVSRGLTPQGFVTSPFLCSLLSCAKVGPR